MRVVQKKMCIATVSIVTTVAPITSPKVPEPTGSDAIATPSPAHGMTIHSSSFEQPPPVEVVPRADQVQLAVGVLGGEDIGVAELDEHGALGLLGATRPSATRASIWSSIEARSSAREVVPLVLRNGPHRRVDVAVGEADGAGHVSPPGEGRRSRRRSRGNRR